MPDLWTIDLSDPDAAPCDLCGPARERLEVERLGIDRYSVLAVAGCYSGERRADVSLGEALAFLGRWEHLAREEVRRLRAEVLADAQREALCETWERATELAAQGRPVEALEWRTSERI